MDKTINVYTPQEKMPEPSTLLWISNSSYGIAVVRYLGGDDWEAEDFVCGNMMYKTEDINWWLDLENLSSSIELSLMNVAWKKSHPARSQNNIRV